MTEPDHERGMPQGPDGSDGPPRGPDGASRTSSPRSSRGSLWLFIRETVIVVGMALLLSLVVKTWLLQAFYIPSESMNDTLLVGDRVIVSKLTPGPFALERGDIVVFDDPDHWLAQEPVVQRGAAGTVLHDVFTFVGLLPSDEGNHLIKRVIGLPGDHVSCAGGGQPLKVNGTAINEPYIRPGDAPSQQRFDITVPPGKVWVMGDHRSDSSDSRFHDDGTGRLGSVPERLIVGRAVSVVWPVSDWRWLGVPNSTFAKVPSPSPATSGLPDLSRNPATAPTS